MANAAPVRCGVCGGEDLEDADDGFFYCRNCGSRADDIIDTGVADEDFVDKGGGLSQGGGALYLASHRRTNAQTQSQAEAQARFSQQLLPKSEPHEDGFGPTEPADFGSDASLKGAVIKEEDYYRVVRWRYIVGLQIMVQRQCEALVKKFRVNPVICGISGSIWLRFVASTGIFEDDWAYQAVLESESQGEKRSEGRGRYEGEPRNIYNERMVIIWCKTLKKAIPLSCSLAVSYLACHIAREPILPTDIVRWTIEGKLPYFCVFTEIETFMEMLDKSIKNIEMSIEMPDKSVKTIMVSIGKPPKVVCPLSSSYMFRPSHAVPLQKLESMAASIAESLGLNLPPVNFYAIASRYLKQLSLPVGKIIPYACRLYEWSMPPDLWLSASESRLPTRVCVMSILVVAIRILYNINGFGKWEMTLSAPFGSSSMDDQVASSDHTFKSDTKDGVAEVSTSQGLGADSGTSSSADHKFESQCVELLKNLEKSYEEVNDKFEYSKDLPTYLQYCKDVLFSGSCEDRAEEELIDQLWDFYKRNQEDIETSVKLESGASQKRSRKDDPLYNTPQKESKKYGDEEPISISADSQIHFQDAKPYCTPSGESTPRTSQANQTPASREQGEASSRKLRNTSREQGEASSRKLRNTSREQGEASSRKLHNTSREQGEASSRKLHDIAIRHLKIDMEEHRFCYIPPRQKVKRHDYLHYVRKKDDGSLTYVAHADYYILLRACAKAAQVDIRIMHTGVLSLERRLGWIEKRIDYCLQEKCCKNRGKSHIDLTEDSPSLTNLRL